jgi:hypothetical protein
VQTLVKRRKPNRFERFRAGLTVRGYASYADYLASKAWRQFHGWYRRSGLPQWCLICGATNFELHHWNYAHIGQEDPCDVVPLCRKHHQRVHEHLAQHGGDVREFERHFQDVFELTETEAAARFRPFRQMYLSFAQTRRCVDCRCRLAPKHPHCRCWKCHKTWTKRGSGGNRPRPRRITRKHRSRLTIVCPSVAIDGGASFQPGTVESAKDACRKPGALNWRNGSRRRAHCESSLQQDGGLRGKLRSRQKGMLSSGSPDGYTAPGTRISRSPARAGPNRSWRALVTLRKPWVPHADSLQWTLLACTSP